MSEPVLYTKIVTPFRDVQHIYRSWGATDSEPNGRFNQLMRAAVGGGPIPEIESESWELFSDIPGHRKAARELTRAARKAYHAFQAAPLNKAIELANYMRWR